MATNKAMEAEAKNAAEKKANEEAEKAKEGNASVDAAPSQGTGSQESESAARKKTAAQMIQAMSREERKTKWAAKVHIFDLGAKRGSHNPDEKVPADLAVIFINLQQKSIGMRSGSRTIRSGPRSGSPRPS